MENEKIEKAKERLERTREILKREYEKNPIVRYEKEPIVSTTTKEDINKFHEALVQFCIDYINEHKLTEVNEVRFNADGLITSCKYRYWTPETDSFIGLRGIAYENGIHKDGKITKIPYWYDIGENC